MDQLPQQARSSPLKWIVLLAAVLGLAAWLYVAPPGLLGKLDAIGYAVCHRIDSHSLHIGTLQMPLCARCTGEFNAAAIGLLFQGVVSPKRSQFPKRGILVVLALFFAAFALDGSNSYLALMKSVSPVAFGRIPNLYTTGSTTRVFTGSGMGLAMAAILYPMYNQSVWRLPVRQAALDWRRTGAVVGVLLAFDLAMLTESPLILYPVAVLSILGVLALLCLVFSVVWIMIMRLDNAFDHLQQLWLPAVAGLTMAFVLILGIDLLRLGLTHTWGGFPGLT